MTILVTIGTTSYRAGTTPAAGEVAFDGQYVFSPDGITPWMVWDAGLGNIREMTQPEKDALPGQVATNKAIAAKAAATAGIDNGDLVVGDKFERLCRSVGLVALDAVNTERTALTAMNTAVQAAASLADLKTRFAAITFPPQVTANQLVAAIKAKIAATAQ